MIDLISGIAFGSAMVCMMLIVVHLWERRHSTVAQQRRATLADKMTDALQAMQDHWDPATREATGPWTPAEREAFGINDTERFIAETDKVLAQLEWAEDRRRKRTEWAEIVDLANAEDRRTLRSIRRNGHSDPVELDSVTGGRITAEPSFDELYAGGQM